MLVSGLIEGVKRSIQLVEEWFSPRPEELVAASEELVAAPGWVDEELAPVELGDQRLNKRLKSVTKPLAAQSQAPINQAGGDWPSTKAAYRLFANDKTEVEEIVAAHRHQTHERMKSHPLVLQVQDTTYLDYTAHAHTQGLGPIGTQQQDLQGLVMHSTMAFTPEGLPLGLLNLQIWERDPATAGCSHERKKRPIEEKESFKWLKALEQSAERQRPECRQVTITDAEGDIFELFQRAGQSGQERLVRAAQNRALVGEPEHRYLWDKWLAQPIDGYLEVEVPAKDNRPARRALVAVRRASVHLRVPQTLKGAKPLPVNAILVLEQDPPAEVDEPLEWLLLSNRPVVTFSAALQRVRWYKARFGIEVYHKVLKSGCTVEHCRLQTAERLQRYIAVMCLIAWRLYGMTPLQRVQPEAPCTQVLTDSEWQALYSFHFNTLELPDHPPTVRQVTLWIAQLGGFLGRKSDGEPGITAVWRGWQRLCDLARLWRITHPQTCG